MLERVHSFLALVGIASCMLERVHPALSSARADVLGGGVLGWVCHTRLEFMSMPRNREMLLEMNSCKLSAASIFVFLVSKETLHPR